MPTSVFTQKEGEDMVHNGTNRVWCRCASPNGGIRKPFFFGAIMKWEPNNFYNCTDGTKGYCPEWQNCKARFFYKDEFPSSACCTFSKATEGDRTLGDCCQVPSGSKYGGTKLGDCL